MDFANMILIILGAAFIGIGSLVGGIFFFAFSWAAPSERFMTLAIPGFFVLVGACMIGGVLYFKHKKALIVKKGKRYEAKIYGYVKDTSVVVNGSFQVNVKVHYFDERHIEREAIIPTKFAEGSDTYPIGMTMDIYEYRGKFGWNPKSVSNKRLFGEEELMDDKPIEPEKLTMIAVSCNHCGSSFKSAAGYAGKCPYCGNYININL